MAIFAISDLHLPLGADKPMDVFGTRWDNYVEKIEYEWKKTIAEEDFVIINGDLSWATYLEESLKDFLFIDKLPGTKLISKGNHDYWWETLTKMNGFLEKNKITRIYFMQNNAYDCKTCAVCGAKGWLSPTDKAFKPEDKKIYERELMRFEASIKKALEINKTVIAALHYPPDEAFSRVIDAYNVKKCVYGHLHGKKAYEYRCPYENCTLVSADFLNFAPIRIF